MHAFCMKFQEIMEMCYKAYQEVVDLEKLLNVSHKK